MTKVTLPRTNQSGANEWSDVEANDNAIIEVVNGELDNENLKSNANIARTKLATEARGVAGKWYTPTVIATEQTRESTSFGTLSTPDEVTGVEVPTNGLIAITYRAHVKSSVSGAGRAAVYIGSNQLKSENNPVERETFSTAFGLMYTSISGLAFSGERSFADQTTGEVVLGEQLLVFVTAGTYAVSIKFKATSGSVTAKERKLWVWTLGY